MKYLKYFALLGLVSIGLMSCADDEEPINNGQGNLSKAATAAAYQKYDGVDYNETQIKNMLDNFNVALNSTSVTLGNQSVKDALFLMETFFNYGIAANIDNDGLGGDEEIHSFELTLPLDANENIDGSSLKSLYLEFVNNVLSQMNGKALSLADMRVKGMSASSVTFEMDLLPPTHGSNLNFNPRRLKNPANIVIPSTTVSNWHLLNYVNDKAIDPNMNLGQERVMAKIVINYRLREYPGYYWTVEPVTVANFTVPVTFDANALATVVIPHVISGVNALVGVYSSLYMPNDEVVGYSTAVHRYRIAESQDYWTGETTYSYHYAGAIESWGVGRIVDERNVAGLFIPSAVSLSSYSRI
ncbi:MAG: hypothetical protein LBO06_00730 [Bacteroidales bacterium]|jgi:hypothetical protein|nr:hypothetical protein [Bacteroidales bacterium]